MELNLLEKTELRIQPLGLQSANLGLIAATVADVLSLDPAKVLVIDVREDHICLDILERTLDMEQVIGKEKLILERISLVPGVEVMPDTKIDSSGILGLIGCDIAEAEQVVTMTKKMTTDIEKNILSRALVYATGFEVKNSMIEDTNSPYLMQILKEQGYKVEFGGIIDDNLSMLRHKLTEAADRGFGLVITTGGVGAEDKDFSVEAVASIDREAVTPWLVKFEQGTGRHVKEGVRIGVGKVGLTTFVNLPGPHDEVVVATEALRKHCECQPIDKINLANDLAEALRGKLKAKISHWQHHHGRHA